MGGENGDFHPTDRMTWSLSTTTWLGLEAVSPVLIEPWDNSSLIWQLDCNLLRNPELEPPSWAAPRFLTHRNCEIGVYFLSYQIWGDEELYFLAHQGWKHSIVIFQSWWIMFGGLVQRKILFLLVIWISYLFNYPRLYQTNKKAGKGH